MIMILLILLLLVIYVFVHGEDVHGAFPRLPPCLYSVTSRWGWGRCPKKSDFHLLQREFCDTCEWDTHLFRNLPYTHLLVTDYTSPSPPYVI